MFRTCVLGCALFGLVGLSIGCNNAKDTRPTPATHEESLKGYETQLGGFDVQVDELKAKADKATGEEKTKLDAKLKDAVAKRDAAKKKLEELDKAAADKWDAINKEAAAAFDEAKKAVKE